MDVKISSAAANSAGAISYDNIVDARNSVDVNSVTKSDTNKDPDKSKTVDDKEQKKTSKDLEVKEAKVYMEALNEFLKVSKADLKMSLHQKTNTLMVQLVDTNSDKVLREFPPKELLDAMAKIHDYIGALLDKKA